MQKTLNELSSGEKGLVKKIIAQGKIKRRLCDMGITPGAAIMLRKVAPLGDPLEINIRGYELSIRKSEAKNVLVDVEGGGK